MSTPGGIILLCLLVGGCAQPIVKTQVVEKPVAVPCEVRLPEECESAYMADKVSSSDNMLKINRALRAEIEQRRACEVKLKAALSGCNKGN